MFLLAKPIKLDIEEVEAQPECTSSEQFWTMGMCGPKLPVKTEISRKKALHLRPSVIT